MTRVAIIGAGPCGLSQMHAFASAKSKGADIPEVVCFEKQSDIGGLWNYSWRTGTDEFGETVHGSMYRYLWSNGPKECLEFADYSFEEHFGKAIPSFPPRAVLADYIKGRAEKSGVRDWCRFSHAANAVEYCTGDDQFSVSVRDMGSGLVTTEDFDYVVVASGHFSVPNVPSFEGFDTYDGRLLHAHDFRDAGEFAGLDILIVGTSYSGEDICAQCHKYGAKSVTISHRTAATGFHWPSSIEEVPLLSMVEGKTAHFIDGTSRHIDAIILCTGYLHHFPFLANDLRLETGNRMWVPGLYKGVVWEGNPKLFYLGMQDQYYTFNMFDAQAWYVRDIIMGRIAVPSRAAMEAHSARWIERESGLQDYEGDIWFQGDYILELLEEVDYPKFDVEGMNQTFMKWEHDKHEDIMTYRDQTHKSLITANQQARYPMPWLNAMDDSLEGYLRN